MAHKTGNLTKVPKHTQGSTVGEIKISPTYKEMKVIIFRVGLF